MENIVIIGSGAQSKYVMDIVSYYSHINIIAVVKGSKDGGSNSEKHLRGVEIIEDIDRIKQLTFDNDIRAIAALADNRQKETIVQRLEELSERCLRRIP